jgi:hypothetical protein
LAVDQTDAEGRVHCPGCGARFLLLPKPLVQDESWLDEELARPTPAAPPLHQITAQQVREAEHFAEAGTRFVRPDRPPDPRWTFLTGVLTFPWYFTTLGVWAGMSFGLSLTLLLGQLTAILLASGASATVVVAGSAFMGLAWAFVLTASYCAACCRPVIEETAAGADVITAWPGVNFREWTAEVWLPGWCVLLAAALGWGVLYLFELTNWTYAVAAAVVVFPLLLLSALETGSALVPYSPLVWRSLLFVCWAWGGFYAVTLAVTLPATMALQAGYPEHPWLTATAAGPALAALFLIESRLLGRLAWRIEQWANRRAEQEADG